MDINWDDPLMKALDEKGFNPGKTVFNQTTLPHGTRVKVTDNYHYAGAMKGRVGTICVPKNGRIPKEPSYCVLWDGATKPMWFMRDFLQPA
jgi:hypothetical protein